MFIAKAMNGMTNTQMDTHMRWILFYIMVAPPNGGDHMIMWNDYSTHTHINGDIS